MDYNALAKQFGGVTTPTDNKANTNAPLDYTALAKQYNGTTYKPPEAPAVEPDKGFGRKVFDFFTSGTQKLGKQLGTDLAAPGNVADFQNAVNDFQIQSTKMMDAIDKAKVEGKDTTRLMEAFKLYNKTGSPQSKDYVSPEMQKELEKGFWETAGSVGLTALEASSGGILSSGAKTLAAKELTTGAKILSGAKVGGTYGSLAGGLNSMSEGGSVGDVAINTAIGGATGATLGALIPIAGAGLSKTTSAIGKSSFVNKLIPMTEKRITQIQKYVNEAKTKIANEYQKTFPLTPSQKNYETQLYKKTGDNVFTTLAKYNINAGSEDVITHLDSLSEQFRNATEMAKANEYAKFNLKEMIKNASNAIDEKLSSATERQSAKKKLTEEVSALIKENPNDVFVNGNGEPVVSSNLMERLRMTGNDWAQYNKLNPDSVRNSIGSSLADAVRLQVEKEGTFTGYRNANKEWGKILHAKEVITKLVDSGKTFKVPGGLSGSIARRVLSGVLGYHVGGIGGAILSELGSEYTAKIMSNPALRTYFDRKLIERFTNTKATPEAVNLLKNEVKNFIDKQGKLLRLESPSSIQLGPEIKTSSVKSVPAKKMRPTQNPKTGKMQTTYSSSI